MRLRTILIASSFILLLIPVYYFTVLQPYHFEEFNVNCQIPFYKHHKLDNIQWIKNVEELPLGMGCEAIMKECSMETAVLVNGQNQLIYRSWWFGSPDSTFYLILDNSQYHCYAP